MWAQGRTGRRGAAGLGLASELRSGAGKAELTGEASLSGRGKEGSGGAGRARELGRERGFGPAEKRRGKRAGPVVGLREKRKEEGKGDLGWAGRRKGRERGFLFLKILQTMQFKFKFKEI